MLLVVLRAVLTPKSMIKEMGHPLGLQELHEMITL